MPWRAAPVHERASRAAEPDEHVPTQHLQRTHGVLKLAFERSLIIDLFIEFGTNPVRLVEYLKSESTILYCAFSGGCKPCLI